jgi:hypothetical protein
MQLITDLSIGRIYYDELRNDFDLQVYTGLGSDTVTDQVSQFLTSISTQLITNLHIGQYILR